MKQLALRLQQALAALLGASILAAAWHDVSTTWDVWYYHLPFAARAARIVGPGEYLFHATNQARYEGFPLLAERLQGLFWRLTGRPEAGNLVAFAALAAFIAWLRRAHRVPLHLAALGLLAVPLVQLHASSCYIDLPSNLAASALVLTVIFLWVDGAPDPRRSLATVLGLAAVVVNMRFQLHPLTAACLLAAAPKLLPPLWKAPSRRPLLLAALSLPVVFAAPLWNLAVHHNPYYPMKLALPGGLTLPGPEGVYANVPAWLEPVPRPFRWAASVLELGIRSFRERRRWTIDQWMPEGSSGNRLGGFFGAYAVVLVGILIRLARRDPGRARKAAIAFAVVTLLSSLWPQSHELRYYMYWMITLVALVLLLVAQGPDAKRELPVIGWLCAAAVGVVLWSTEAGYAYPSGSTFAEIVQSKVKAGVIERAQEGDKICVRHEPWTFLYTARFHAGKRYAVKEVEKREECGDYRWEE